jgi:hypothetical protein
MVRASSPIAHSLWEPDQEQPILLISPITGRPALSLSLADDAQTRWANIMVTRYHYLRAPVDIRSKPLAYLVLLGGRKVGCLMFGRPEATRAGTWYGDVADKEAGRCRFSRWELLNLSRVWLDPAVQQGGTWYSPDLLPGFHDRQGIFHSSLASTVIAIALDCVVVDYLIAFQPVDVREPYQIAEVLSYCSGQHKGTIYQQGGFRLERENRQGLQTYAKPVRPLTQGEDEYIHYLAERSPRSRHYRALRANTWTQLQFPLEEGLQKG